jgi:mRNA interferase MazF
MPRVPLKRGDVVLVPFPFTDLTAEKLRPAVIVSPDPQELDVVIAFISSTMPSKEMAETDFLLTPDHPDFAKTGLKKRSVFKMS